MELTARKVEDVFVDCLFKDEKERTEDKSEHIKVEGLVHNFEFNPVKIEKHKDEIVSMLQELPVQFHQGTGGGWTFLNACNDKNGKQWTGLHSIMEMLFCLGFAIKKCKYLMPREMWKVFPGGMPYIVILN